MCFSSAALIIAQLLVHPVIRFIDAGPLALLREVKIMSEIRPVKRALISVSDKTGLIEAAQELVAQGVVLLSTGGTCKALAEAGLPVLDVADVTGFPEMMDGRVKTLHPAVHGGLLALRDLPHHSEAMKAHNIEGIDLLWVNLYPFEATLASGADFETCIENIDIGGPAMIRAGAKNFGWCAVATDLSDVRMILADMTASGGDRKSVV